MPKILKVRKRDGTLENFNPEKIKIAVEKAVLEVKGKDGKTAQRIAKEVVKELETHFSQKVIPRVEDIQDIVEERLIKNKLADVAKAFILYRKEHKEIREFKTFLGVRDELKLTPNAVRVLARRYLLRDSKGNITETPGRLFRRVAKAVASADSQFSKGALKNTEEEFYNMMANLEFLPNSPTLMNAGAPLGQLSACFVLPIEDSLISIFDALKESALIHQSGGGTGFNFSKLRPKGDLLKKTMGFTSGPISFMKIFNTTTDVINQGGKRRGANMGMLNHNHPDVLDFINCKNDEVSFQNFNISVSVTDDFMTAALKDKEYPLINPRTKEKVRNISAKEVFDLIVNAAWKTGDPGIVFIDEINRKNPTIELGKITATNPCGEQPLYDYESCNLGSINLVKMIKKGSVDWTKLKNTVHKAVHFLDNVIDVNKFPFEKIEEQTKANRKIGLGIMGWAELLIILGIRYDSPKALLLAEKLMKFITEESHKASAKLGELRGNFPNFEKSSLKKHFKFMRNAAVTTIAPTGTISIIAGVTSSIEPLFAVSYVRNVLAGAHLLEINPEFEQLAKEKGFYSKKLMMKIAKTGSLKGVKEVPKKIQDLFKTALEIPADWHVKMQAVFQKYTDNAVSKTINLPENASPKEVSKAFLLAHKLKCKGITIYRYNSKKDQVLTIGEHEPVIAGSEYAGGHCKECVF